MNEQLFILCQDDLGNYEIRYDDKVFHFLWEVAPILNEQQATITELERKLKKYAKINQVIIDLHNDIRNYNRKVKMQDHIIDTQQDIINALVELVSLINDKE